MSRNEEREEVQTRVITTTASVFPHYFHIIELICKMAGSKTASSSSATAKATVSVGTGRSKYELFLEKVPNRILVIIPLIIPSYLLLFHIVMGNTTNSTSTSSSDSRHIIGYIFISILGFIMTQQLIPHISLYTLRKNIYGKDLGKKNTSMADVPMYV